MIKEALWLNGWNGWMDGMVVIGRRYSKSTFGANKKKVVLPVNTLMWRTVMKSYI